MDRTRAPGTQPTGPDPAGQGRTSASDAARQDRLKAALKANIARRKAQARARSDAQEQGSQAPDRDDVPERARLPREIGHGTAAPTGEGGTD